MTAPATLVALLADRAAHDPRAEALRFGNRAYTCEEIWRGVERAAWNLVRLGVARREPIVIALGNGPSFFSAFYGAQRAGAIPVPAFPGLGSDRLAVLSERCGARRVIVETPSAIEKARPSRQPEVIPCSALEQHAEPRPTPTLEPDDLAYVQYTSGSTGEAKGVQLSHRNVLTNIRQLIAGFDISPRDVFVSWLPAYHDMGLVLMTMVPLALGSRLVLLPASLRSLVPWLRVIESYRGTFTAAPDFGYRMALRVLRDREPPDLSSLRVALNAAEPVRATTIRAFEQCFDLSRVMIAGYGLAEATVGVAAWKPGAPPLVDDSGTVSVGQPFPGVEVVILASEGPAAPGQTGEILVRSRANTRGYLGEPAATSSLFWRDGFLRTGDLGYVDTDGNLFVVGRLKQMILQAGRNIAPREVEEVVDALPFVRRSAAVGIDRGDEAGEQLYVIAEQRGSARPERPDCRQRVVDIVDTVRNQLGLRPGRVYLAAPRSIPLTANGKLRYRELEDALGTDRLRRAGALWYPEW